MPPNKKIRLQAMENVDSEVSEFARLVEVAFQDDREKYDQFSTWSRITIPSWDKLPWDLLDVISRKLDFDDLFQFSRVCTDWRLFHQSIDKSKLLSSQEPLLVEFFHSPLQCSFTSLPNQKVYPLKNIMMNTLSYSDDTFPIYVTCSSGYFIIVADNSSLLLINPFTRIKKKVICPSTFEFSFSYRHSLRALLAFEKCSDEFVLVFLFKESNRLHVYQSRNNAWVTYTNEATDDCVEDFVALNNIIYVVTSEPKIGVLHLNSASIEYLPLNSPDLDDLSFYNFDDLSFFNLVKCDEELLLVRLNPHISSPRPRGPTPDRPRGPTRGKKVYRIDFSTMTYVELKTLGDIALFYVCLNSCEALSNPGKWGYESNSVYEVGFYSNYTVYNWDKKSKKDIVPPNPKIKGSKVDWCFRHLKYEVDCSL